MRPFRQKVFVKQSRRFNYRLIIRPIVLATQSVTKYCASRSLLFHNFRKSKIYRDYRQLRSSWRFRRRSMCDLRSVPATETSFLVLSSASGSKIWPMEVDLCGLGPKCAPGLRIIAIRLSSSSNSAPREPEHAKSNGRPKSTEKPLI